MSSLLTTLLRLRSLPRRADLDDRATVLALFARFVDELGSGLLVVLVPTLRTRLGLTVGQVGWCFQAMSSAGALVEPLAAAAIDVTRRRPLLVAGATCWAAALLLTAAAPSFAWLVVAFALVGAAYGPLANTADVVLVEGHPEAVERISARTTAVDTVGALLAPGAVAAAAWSGTDPLVLLTVAGVGTLVYAALLAGTAFPAPAPRPAERRIAVSIGANVRDVARDRRARLAIGALLAFEVVEVPELFEPVWLRDVVGVGQATIAVHTAIGLAGGLAGVVALDRWLAGRDATRLLVGSALVGMVLHPAWLFVPGIAAKLVLVAARYAAAVPLWSVLRGRALAAVPGRAGAVGAVLSLVGVLPLHAAFGWLADQVGLTTGMLVVNAIASLVLVRLLRQLARDPSP